MAKWLIKLRKFLWIINLKEWVDFLLNEGVMEINGETQHKLRCRGNWIDIENLVPHCKRKRKNIAQLHSIFVKLLDIYWHHLHFIVISYVPQTHTKKSFTRLHMQEKVINNGEKKKLPRLGLEKARNFLSPKNIASDEKKLFTTRKGK